MQNSTQRLGGLDCNDLLSAAQELERQPTRAGADLDDSPEAARQPPQHPRVEPLRADEPVVKLRLEPVEKLPGEGDVGLRITAPVRDEPARFVFGENTKVRPCVAPLHLSTPPLRGLRRDHRPRPSSCLSPTAGPSATAPPEAPGGSSPRRPAPGSRRLGSA